MSEHADKEYDVVVIGSGVAGALISWKLAKAGARVLILEAGERGPDRLELVGRWVRTPDRGGAIASPYRGRDGDKFAPFPENDRDYEQAGPQRFKSTYVRRVGGSTWHWLGNVPRFLPRDFSMRSSFGLAVDWPIGYDDLERWYCEAEHVIGVSGNHDEWNGLFGAYRSRDFPMSEIWPSYADRQIRRAIDGLTFEGVPLRMMSTPQARNSQPYHGRPVCAGNSTCVPICPIGAKYDATVHIQMAEVEGAEVREQAVVSRLHADQDGLVRQVSFKTWDGLDHSVSGRVVVLAAHAIESPRLLLLSADERTPGGVANRSGQVGRNLMDHLQGAATARASFPLFPFRGPPTTSGIDTFRDGDFRARHAAFRMSFGNDGHGREGAPVTDLMELVDKDRLFGRELRERLADRVSRQWRISYSTEQLPNPSNRVELSDQVDALGLRKAKLTVGLDAYNTDAFEVARRVMRTLFLAVGDAEGGFASDPNAYSGAGHIMGTCRMGHAPEQSVVNADCRAHDHPNLFIVGASVFSTGGTANPTLTVAALALRAVPAITEHLTRS
ncbi:MAG: GMC family oxidoreductase [Longimicrobiaceae bacterium]